MKCRDLINSINHVAGNQKITTHQFEDRDIIGYAEEGNDAVVQVFFVRNGKLIGREHFYMNTVPGDTGMDIVTNFIKQYYVGISVYSKRVICATEIEDEELISKLLSRKSKLYGKNCKTEKRSERKTCGACK